MSPVSENAQNIVNKKLHLKITASVTLCLKQTRNDNFPECEGSTVMFISIYERKGQLLCN